jgi:hypothetical protein
MLVYDLAAKLKARLPLVMMVFLISQEDQRDH